MYSIHHLHYAMTVSQAVRCFGEPTTVVAGRWECSTRRGLGYKFSPEFAEFTDFLGWNPAECREYCGARPPFKVPRRYYQDTLWIDGLFFGCSKDLIKKRLGKPTRERTLGQNLELVEYSRDSGATLVLLSKDRAIHIEGSSTSTIYGEEMIAPGGIDKTLEIASPALATDPQSWRTRTYRDHQVLYPPPRDRFSAAFAIAIKDDSGLFVRKSMLVINSSSFFLQQKEPLSVMPEALLSRAVELGETYNPMPY